MNFFQVGAIQMDPNIIWIWYTRMIIKRNRIYGLRLTKNLLTTTVVPLTSTIPLYNYTKPQKLTPWWMNCTDTSSFIIKHQNLWKKSYLRVHTEGKLWVKGSDTILRYRSLFRPSLSAKVLNGLEFLYWSTVNMAVAIKFGTCDRPMMHWPIAERLMRCWRCTSADNGDLGEETLAINAGARGRT